MNNDEISQAIKAKYANVAKSASGIFRYPTGRAGLDFLGYDEAYFESLPQPVVESFCGVGNPFLPTQLKEGGIVLDIGSGAGFDLIYAAQLVGSHGKVYGLDLTSEMVAKALSNLNLLKIRNVEVQIGDAKAIPFPDESFDTVISNGVLNLTLNKKLVFAEIYRVLKKGGRLQFADIILADNANIQSLDTEAWSN